MKDYSDKYRDDILGVLGNLSGDGDIDTVIDAASPEWAEYDELVDGINNFRCQVREFWVELKDGYLNGSIKSGMENVFSMATSADTEYAGGMTEYANTAMIELNSIQALTEIMEGSCESFYENNGGSALFDLYKNLLMNTDAYKLKVISELGVDNDTLQELYNNGYDNDYIISVFSLCKTDADRTMVINVLTRKYKEAYGNVFPEDPEELSPNVINLVSAYAYDLFMNLENADDKQSYLDFINWICYEDEDYCFAQGTCHADQYMQYFKLYGQNMVNMMAELTMTEGYLYSDDQIAMMKEKMCSMMNFYNMSAALCIYYDGSFMGRGKGDTWSGNTHLSIESIDYEKNPASADQIITFESTYRDTEGNITTHDEMGNEKTYYNEVITLLNSVSYDGSKVLQQFNEIKEEKYQAVTNSLYQLSKTAIEGVCPALAPVIEMVDSLGNMAESERAALNVAGEVVSDLKEQNADDRELTSDLNKADKALKLGGFSIDMAGFFEAYKSACSHDNSDDAELSHSNIMSFFGAGGTLRIDSIDSAISKGTDVSRNIKDLTSGIYNVDTLATISKLDKGGIVYSMGKNDDITLDKCKDSYIRCTNSLQADSQNYDMDPDLYLAALEYLMHSDANTMSFSDFDTVPEKKALIIAMYNMNLYMPFLNNIIGDEGKCRKD